MFMYIYIYEYMVYLYMCSCMVHMHMYGEEEQCLKTFGIKPALYWVGGLACVYILGMLNYKSTIRARKDFAP